MDRKEIRTRLEAAFAKVLSENRGPDKKMPHYVFEAEPLSDDGAEFDLAIRFVAGSVYCCDEPGCHVHFTEETWLQFRENLREAGWEPPRPMRIPHFSIRIEGGALMTDQASWGSHPAEVESHENSSDSHDEALECAPRPERSFDPRTHARRLKNTREDNMRRWQERKRAGLRDAEDAVSKAPMDYRAWKNLACQRWPDDKPGTIHDMREAVRLAPGNVFMRGSLAQILRLARFFDEADVEYAAIEREHPDLTWPAHFRSLIKLERRDFGAAEAGFSEVIHHNPAWVPARHRRAETRFRLGKYEEALVDFDACVRLDPDFTSPRRERLAALGALGRWEDVLSEADDFIRGLRRGKDRFAMRDDATLMRARALLALARPLEALRDLDSWIVPGRIWAEPWHLAAQAHRMLGQLKEEDETLGRAIEQKPKHSRYRVERAILRATTGDVAGAREDVTEALRLWPECGSARTLQKGIEKGRSAEEVAGAVEEARGQLGREFPEDLLRLA